ncbi:anti-CBASS protein Acb1 family protein [Enterobacter cancerogenus]
MKLKFWSSGADSAPATGEKQVADDGLENLISGLNTLADKQAHTRYKTVKRLTDDKCANMLRGSWAAGKMARIPGEDMVREGWYISSASLEDKEVAALNKAANDMVLDAKVMNAIAFGRAYGGTFLFVGKPGETTRDDPFDESDIRMGDSLALAVLDKTMLSPETTNIDADPGSPTFGEPLLYTLNNSMLKIHRSRMMGFIGKSLPYQEYQKNGYWHDSVYQDSQDAIMRYDTAATIINSLLHESNNDVMRIKGMTKMLATEEGEKQIKKRFSLTALMKSTVNMLLMDSEDEYARKAISFAGINDILTSFRFDTAGAADIPLTRFFGQSPGGLNSTGETDLRNYYDMIGFRQRILLKPHLIRFYRLLCISLFGKAPDDLDINFHPLWQTDPKDEAQTKLNNAQADQIYVDMGAVRVATVTGDLIAKEAYSTIGKDDEMAAKEMDDINDDNRSSDGNEGANEDSPIHPEPEARSEDQTSSVRKTLS